MSAIDEWMAPRAVRARIFLEPAEFTSFECAVKPVGQPDAPSAADGKPNFASEAHRLAAKVTSLKAHSYRSRPVSLLERDKQVDRGKE